MSDIDGQISHLCEVCLKVFSHHPDFDTEYSHHAGPAALREAKDGGCVLCNIIWDSFQEHHKEEIVWFVTKIFSHPPLLLQFHSKNRQHEGDWKVVLWIGPHKEGEYELL